MQIVRVRVEPGDAGRLTQATDENARHSVQKPGIAGRRPSGWIALTLLGTLLTLSSLAVVLAWTADVGPGQAVTIPLPAAGERPLRGTYYPGRVPAGVLLLEGFGSDQVAMHLLGSYFCREGWHVMAFDFSGHGRSPGRLGFDNAATDRQALEVLAAKARFEQLSGLADGQIVLVGHSLGARAALQAATLDSGRVAGLALLGTQVNLGTNTQSQIFTGVSDADLAWVQGLGPRQPRVNVLLVSGTWDDILTPFAARLLFERLAGPDAAPLMDASQAEPDAAGNQTWVLGDVNEGSQRKLVLVSHVLHNYEIYAYRVTSWVGGWATDVVDIGRSDGITYRNKLDHPSVIHQPGLWVAGLCGIFMALFGGRQWARAVLPVPPPLPRCVAVTDSRRFLWARLLLWLPALPLAVLLAGLFFAVPLGTPVFNLIYVGLIGGYGLLLWLLYRLGRVPGTHGRLPFQVRAPAAASRRRLAAALGIGAALLVVTAAYARSGWFYVPPSGDRLLWLLLFTPVTALAFWIGAHEGEMLALAAPGRAWPRLAHGLIGLLPFGLWTAFLAAIGSLSGMIGGLQGLVILGLALALGGVVQAVAQRPWLTAVLQAGLLYWLVLPQGALFGM